MVRRLKAYITTLGFFELAVAAPSMKAALEAWGVRHNLFQRGEARETDDPKVVAATMARPGIVLKRIVGTNGDYVDSPSVPPTFRAGRLSKARPISAKSVRYQRKHSAPKEEKRQSAAIIQFDKERARGLRQRQREQKDRVLQEARKARRAAQHKKRLEAKLGRAQKDHEKRLASLERKRQSVEAQIRSENDRWTKTEKELDAEIDSLR